MKLLIFGATGGTGRHVIKQALQQGHQVTAFARDPEKMDITDPHLDTIKGDVLNINDIDDALPGHDAVICVLGLPNILDKSQLRSRGTKNIITALNDSRIKRFICLSSFGAGSSYVFLPFFYKYLIAPLLMRALYADHNTQEYYIKQSELMWTIVRPASLTNGEKTQCYKCDFSAADEKIKAKISRADVADFMLKQLTDSTYLYCCPSISY